MPHATDDASASAPTSSSRPTSRIRAETWRFCFVALASIVVVAGATRWVTVAWPDAGWLAAPVVIALGGLAGARANGEFSRPDGAGPRTHAGAFMVWSLWATFAWFGGFLWAGGEMAGRIATWKQSAEPKATGSTA